MLKAMKRMRSCVRVQRLLTFNIVVTCSITQAVVVGTYWGTQKMYHSSLGGLFKWSEIASKMASGRTDSMCSRRWAQLNEASEVTEYFAKAMKKNALMMPHLSQRGRRRSKTKITVEVSGCQIMLPPSFLLLGYG